MKIWYISKYANNKTTEGATRHFMISKAFASQGVSSLMIYSRSNGYKHKMFYGLYKETVEDSVKCIQLNGPIVNFGFSLKRIFSWFLFEFNLIFYALTRKKSERPDVVIASSLSLLTFVSAFLLKRMFGCKLIVEVRDIWPATVIEIGRLKEKSLFAVFLKKVELFGYKKADGIVATMPRFDLYLSENFNISKKVICIPQGYDETWVNEPDVIQVPFDKNFFNVCHSGTVGKANNVEHLLKAASLIENENIKIYILGDGPLKEDLIRKYDKLSNVVFLKAIPKNDVIRFISNADLLVNMWGDYKMYRYGISPYKWVDYMLAGVPILVSYNGYQSIINEANCGFFIEANNPKLLADKIVEISKLNREILKELGENGKNFATINFNYTYLGNQFLKFINEC